MDHTFSEDIDWFVCNIESRMSMLPTFANAAATLSERVDEDLDKFIDQHGEDKVLDDNEELLEFSVPPEYSGRYKILSRSYRNAIIFADLLPKMALVSLVSLFDAYLDRLVRTLLKVKPEILNGSNKQLTFAQISEFSDLGEAKDYIINLEVQSLIRDSHTAQFEWLENRLGIGLRKDLPIWKEFVEITERRNLIVHADAVVSKNYLNVCKNEKIDCDLKVGDRLEVPPDYYMRACDVFAELGVKLGQVMWRKLLPGDVGNADTSLISVVYNFLFHGEYELAEVLAVFADIPAIKLSCSKNEYYLKVNLAIALKGQQKDKELKSVLNSLDWTALSDEFQIAYAVLNEDWESAARLMERIGKNGILDKNQYRSWPLFRWFRRTNEFKDTYKKIFDEEYKIHSTDTEDLDVRDPDDNENDALNKSNQDDA